MFAAVTAAGSFTAGFVAEGAQGEVAGRAVPINQWVHVAVVLDPASRVLTTFLDGVRTGQATDVGVNAAQILSQGAASANRLYLGRPINDGAASLHGRLRDVRVYRVALTDAQVADRKSVV